CLVIILLWIEKLVGRRGLFRLLDELVGTQIGEHPDGYCPNDPQNVVLVLLYPCLGPRCTFVERVDNLRRCAVVFFYLSFFRLIFWLKASLLVCCHPSFNWSRKNKVFIQNQKVIYSLFLEPLTEPRSEKPTLSL